MKQIKIKDNSTEAKVKAVGGIFFGELSGIEMGILLELIAYDQPQLQLSPMLSKSIKTSLNLSDSTFNVSLSRLHKKRAIIKQKSLITLSPILNGIQHENSWVIKFGE